MSNFLQKNLFEKELTLNEELTEKQKLALEFLFSRHGGAFSLVNKKEFADAIVGLEGLNNLKYAKKLLSELVEKAFVVKYRNEQGYQRVVSCGNILIDFSGYSEHEHFSIRWNQNLLPSKPVFLQKRIPRASRVYYSLQNLFLERLGNQDKITFSITFKELRKKLGLKEGQYCSGRQFLYPTFVNLLLAPNILRISDTNGLFIAYERVILTIEDSPQHGIIFSIARKPSFSPSQTI